MITSKAVEKKKETKDFPVIKRWVNGDNNFCVLFISRHEGTVIETDGKKWSLGHYSSGWFPCDDEDWEDFEGDIIISQ